MTSKIQRNPGLSPQLERWKDHQNKVEANEPHESSHLSAAARERLAKWGTIGGLAMVGGGMLGAMVTAAAVASSPIGIFIGTAVALAGIVVTLTSGGSGGGTSSSDINSLANPGSAVHQLMNQTTMHF